MAAVAGGLGAAIIWSVGSIGAARAARLAGPLLTLAWVMLIGLVLMVFILAVSWTSASLSLGALGWLVLSGAGNVAGLLLMYRALRLGRVGVVMPIVTTEGGIAALIAVAAGQSVGVGAGVALIATMIGVLLTAGSGAPAAALPAAAAGSAATRPAADELSGVAVWRTRSRAVADPTGHTDRRAAAWASLGALCFGVGLYATGRAGADVPLAWAVMPPRVVGVIAITIPLALGGRLTRPPGAGRWLLLSGVCEVAGFFAYTLGAKHNIAIAAVLATLTGTFGTLFGWLFFGERLRSRQLAGVGIIFVGVAAISALTT